MKNYIFYLEPYTYSNTTMDEILLINTLDGSSIYRNDSPEIVKIINTLKQQSELYVTFINEEEFGKNSVHDFITEVRLKFMGDIYLFDKQTAIKPIQFIPQIKDMLPRAGHKSINSLMHLRCINLYINNLVDCDESDYFHYKPNKQFKWILTGNKYISLNIEQIHKVLKMLSKGNAKLNLLGGNIFDHENIDEITSIINKYNILANYYVHYKNLLSIDKNLIKQISSKKIVVMVDFDDTSYLYETFNGFENACSFQYQFIVKSDDELELTDKFVEDFEITNYIIRPYYDGNNISFFNNNVFLDRSMILSNKISLREIYANSITNTLNYGDITIMPDKNVYANLNHNVLGNIEYEELSHIICKEITTGNSWKLTRNNVDICKNCVMRDICSPISNYELVMERFNLCNIR